jgi:hypothetical protein
MTHGDTHRRYGVSGSMGTKDGKRFVVWDRYMRRAASWHRTFKQAQAAAWKANRG